MTDHSRNLVGALHEAADHMDRCASGPPEQARHCFHEAFTRVIGVRNHLMRAVARDRNGGAVPPPRTAQGGGLQLEQLNTLLSLMASFDFPLAGFHPERLDAARQEIRSMLKEEGKAARKFW